MSTEMDPKEELKRLMAESESKSVKERSTLEELVQWNQMIHDLAASSKVLIDYTPVEEIDFEQQIQNWQNLNGQQDSLSTGLAALSGYRRQFYGLVATAGTLSGTAGYDFVRHVPPARREHVQLAAQQMEHVVNGFVDTEKVEKLLTELNMDMAPSGRKSPLEHFHTAWAAYNLPVTGTSPVITSLIPMRECIEGVINELLRRRRTQSPVKGWRDRIMTIGAQLGRAEFTRMDFVDLADAWQRPGRVQSSLEDELSAAKEANIDRGRWLGILRRATLFLEQLLIIVDPSRLRRLK